MKKHQRYDAGELRKPKAMPNGFLQADSFLTRTGVFTYRNGDGSKRRELRLKDEVFSEDSLESLRMTSITMGHPSRPVTSDNARGLSIGTVGQDVREDLGRVRATLMITDGESIQVMKQGRRQLSCGYWCDLEDSHGFTEDGQEYDAIQRGIVYNHVAIVDEGRAGPEVAARMDSKDAQSVGVMVLDAEWTTAEKNSLPDSSFLLILSGGKKDDKGKTVPRSLRKFPVKNSEGAVDLPHLRNALSRIPQSDISQSEKGRLMKQARAMLENEKEDSGDSFVTDDVTNEDNPYSIKEMDGMWFVFKDEDGKVMGEHKTKEEAAAQVAALYAAEEDEERHSSQSGSAYSADEETDKMKIKITVDGVDYELEGNESARQAIRKRFEEDSREISNLKSEAEKITTEASSKLDVAEARADAAEEKVKELEKARTDAEDPDRIREVVRARVALEAVGARVLGDEFKPDSSDEEIKRCVVLAISPGAAEKLDGCSNDYLEARFDHAVEGHGDKVETEKKAKESLGEVRAAAQNADGVNEKSRLDEARDNFLERNRSAWTKPLSASKDRSADPVSVAN